MDKRNVCEVLGKGIVYFEVQEKNIWIQRGIWIQRRWYFKNSKSLPFFLLKLRFWKDSRLNFVRIPTIKVSFETKMYVTFGVKTNQ